MRWYQGYLIHCMNCFSTLRHILCAHIRAKVIVVVPIIAFIVDRNSTCAVQHPRNADTSRER
jgi:hypothetical protein